jgi:hypothetical protein
MLALRGSYSLRTTQFLRTVGWFVPDVSGQRINRIFKEKGTDPKTLERYAVSKHL